MLFQCAVCRYIGVALEHDFDANAKLKKETRVGFEWRLQFAGYDERQVVKQLCYHACDEKRDVPPPQHWATAMDCATFSTNPSVKNVKDETLLQNIECVMVGVTKHCPIHARASQVSGAAVSLNVADKRQDYLLVAHVRENVWLCHGGSRVSGAVDADNPFDPGGLVQKDIMSDAWDVNAAPQTRQRAMGKELQALAHDQSHAWSKCVARALWEAELLRSPHKPFNMDVASAGFERNPFKWRVAGRASHADVAFAWSWSDGGRQHELVEVRADNLNQEGRLVPKPLALKSRDEQWWSDLAKVAEKYLLCKYLGKHQDGDYQPDPAKWKCTSGHKSQATVWYEWLHVLRGRDKKEHRVCAIVNHLIHHQQGILGNPLANACSSELCFSLEYMKALADAKWPGTVFEGVSYESDRPGLIQQVPDGGIDIQEHPLYWTLPCGRTDSMSIREFADAKEDQLESWQSDEAYVAVAKEMEFHVLGITGDELTMAALRDDPGTLAEKRWESVQWSMPLKDSIAQCISFANTHNTFAFLIICLMPGDGPVLVGG